MILAHVGIDVVGKFTRVIAVGAFVLWRYSTLVPKVARHVGLFRVAVVTAGTEVLLLGNVDCPRHPRACNENSFGELVVGCCLSVEGALPVVVDGLIASNFLCGWLVGRDS